MIEDGTHTWHWVVSSFRDDAADAPFLAPMAGLAERLATSPYAAGLFPVRSMHTIRLYQQERNSVFEETIQIDFDHDAGEFVVRHFSPGGGRYYAGGLRIFNQYQPAPGVWMRRSRDGFAALERCFHHLRWFVEYDGVVPPTRPRIVPEGGPSLR